MRGWLIGAGLVIVAIAAFLLWRAIRDPVVVTVAPRPVTATDAAAAPPPPAPAYAMAPPADAELSTAQIAARDERVAAVAAMRSSGDALEPWANDGRRVIADLVVPGARATEVGCYIAGCVGVVTFDSEAAARAAIAELEASDPWKAWTGGKKITTAEVAGDGHTTVAVVLSRPD